MHTSEVHIRAESSNEHGNSLRQTGTNGTELASRNEAAILLSLRRRKKNNEKEFTLIDGRILCKKVL